MSWRRWGVIPLLPAMAFVTPPSKTSKPVALPAEIQAQLVTDARDKLIAHYEIGGEAASEAGFDFRSRDHALLEPGLLRVRGDYLLPGKEHAARTGHIDLFYVAGDSGWSAVQRHRVEEREVPLHAVMVQVRDGLSGEPLAGATVVARDGMRHSGELRTGARGEVRLTLLSGTFRIFATHPRYHSGVAPRVPVPDAQSSRDIFLLPLETR